MMNFTNYKSMKVWKIITDLTLEESDNIHDLFTQEDGD